MRAIKDELQNIILGDEPVGASGKLKKVQVFLSRNAGTGVGTKKQQCLKSEEAAELITFANRERPFYENEIREDDYITYATASSAQRNSWLTIASF